MSRALHALSVDLHASIANIVQKYEEATNKAKIDVGEEKQKARLETETDKWPRKEAKSREVCPETLRNSLQPSNRTQLPAELPQHVILSSSLSKTNTVTDKGLMYDFARLWTTDAAQTAKDKNRTQTAFVERERNDAENSEFGAERKGVILSSRKDRSLSPTFQLSIDATAAFTKSALSFANSLFILNSGLLSFDKTTSSFVDTHTLAGRSLIVVNDGSLIIDACSIANIHSSSDGSVMNASVTETDSLSVRQCTFSHCTSDGSRGVLRESCDQPTQREAHLSQSRVAKQRQSPFRQRLG
ncbi:hypothetical protein BLNAU_10342 [Blattamonas nauphoetae]|uniref:Right handed beta helix domain-containing protein n=1 Tax=Blattamonas nauphoetae TaxID=2049346 RepID=A0ABQ9XT82_9EUKA|nr:hypothetical protein BLNAU_10342 [Blattamonas nauphoetae]